MAQTKRKTKHRGNAAGQIEARGRTGRPPTAEEKKKADKAKSREERLSKPPTWSGSAKRAALAGAFMFVFLFLTSHPKHSSRVVPALLFAVCSFLIYIPAAFYLEMFLYRRRQAKKQQTSVKR
jgi:hypothetical protein